MNMIATMKARIHDNRWYALALAVCLFFLTACENLEQMNQNPNNPSAVPSHMLMNGAEKWVLDAVTDVYLSGRAYILYSQYWAQRFYTDESRYQFRQDQINTLFDNLYRGIYNLEKVVRLNTEPASAAVNAAYGANCNQIAAATILKVWAMSLITDTWGDVPYTDAAKLDEGLYYTRYDTQKDIYAGMLAELKEAVAMIDESRPAFVSGSDMIYDGDATKWKRFGNSLRCRLAVHLSKVDPAWKDYIREAVADGVFQSLDDAALFHYAASGTDYCKFYESFFVRGRNDFTITRQLADLMTGTPDTLNGKTHPWPGITDPRLRIYAHVKDGVCKGMAYGVSSDDVMAAVTGTPDWSANPPFFLAKDFAFPIMTYAELQFILCEANGYSVEEYRNGVQSSIRFWAIQSMTDITTEEAFAYIDAVSERVDAETLAVQKYIDLYLNGAEAWTEIRRTGYPEQLVRPGEVSTEAEGRQALFVPFHDTKGFIARRHRYPSSESTLNNAYWQEAVGRLQDGTNNLYSPMYWDVRTSAYDHPANR